MRGGEERGREVVAGAAGQLRKLQFESSLPGANTGTLSVWTKNIHLDSFVTMKSRFHPANDFF